MSKAWRLEQARRRYQNTMDICDVDLGAVMGPLHRTPHAMIIPVFAFEPGPLTQWSLAQVEGYQRIIPWHILSLYKYSDFAEADISLFIALSDSVYPHFEETLAACNFPAERVLRFNQHPKIRAWINKLIPMFLPRMEDYDGIIHTDASNLMFPSKNGNTLHIWQQLAEKWNVATQEFVLVQPPLTHRPGCGSSLLAGIKRCEAELGITPDETWKQLSRLSLHRQSAKKLQTDWERMVANDKYYEFFGPVFGIAKKTRNNPAFRAHITDLCSILEVDEGAFSFYFYERQLKTEKTYQLPILGGLESYKRTVELAHPCYLWAPPIRLDEEDKQIWEHYYRSLRHDAPLHKP